MISVSLGFHSVNVPVLSNNTILTALDVSSTSHVLISIQRFAPVPVATVIAIGVARPIAQGQAITIVATATNNALAVRSVTSVQIISYNRVIIHCECKRYASTAITRIHGTKTREILSTRCCIGGLLACASRTDCIIPASIV